MSAAKVKSPSTKKLIKPKPKGATNAFGFYIAEQLKSQTSFDRTGTAMIDASEQWKLMSDEEKAPYAGLAKKDLERYNAEKEHLNAMRLKRPCNSYLLYVKDFMAREKGNYPSITDAVSRASTEWKEMSDSQKAPFVNQAKTLSDKYKQDKARLGPQTNAAVAPKEKKVTWIRSSTSALKPRSRAATTKSAPKAKKSASGSTKSRSASTASKAKKSGTKTVAKPRAASKARSATKPRAASKARAASKPRTASKARKPLKAATKGKKAGSKK